MKLPRQWLRRISRLLLLCLAFQNLAIAAHDCRFETAPTEAAALAMRDCPDGQHKACQPLPDSSLCAKHCSPDRATTIDPPTFAALLSVLPPVALATTVPVCPIALALQPIPPKPPIRTRYCSLLI